MLHLFCYVLLRQVSLPGYVQRNSSFNILVYLFNSDPKTDSALDWCSVEISGQASPTKTNASPAEPGSDGERLLQPDKYIDIVINSLRFLVEDSRISLNAFVIMDNHIHVIRQMMADVESDAVRRDFMKYTAQKIKKDVVKNYPGVLAHFKVGAKDKEHPRLTGRAGVLGKKIIEC